MLKNVAQELYLFCIKYLLPIKKSKQNEQKRHTSFIFAVKRGKVNMNRIWILFLMLLWVLPLWGQQSNPFEIRVKRHLTGANEDHSPEVASSTKRVNKKIEKTEEKQLSPTSESGNPFEKEHFTHSTTPIKQTGSTFNRTISSKPTYPSPITAKSDSVDYLFWILTFLLLLLSILININRSVPGIIYRAVSNESFLNNLALTSNPQMRIVMNMYYFFYLINMGIFIYLIGRTWMEWEGMSWLFKSIAIVIAVYAVYLGALVLFKWIYPVDKEMTLYLFNIRMFESSLGFILLLLNFIIGFSSPGISLILIKVGIVLVLLFYLMRIARGLFLSYRFILSNTFHFILYLCAFEIAPFLILYQWMHHFRIS